LRDAHRSGVALGNPPFPFGNQFGDILLAVPKSGFSAAFLLQVMLAIEAKEIRLI
jgi:hypothetical protein